LIQINGTDPPFGQAFALVLAECVQGV